MDGPTDIVVRDARDADGPALVALIAAVFAEYPGCVLDVEGECPELLAIATAFRAAGGRFWVAEAAGAVVGCVGVTPAEDGSAVELRKLYVARAARRRGLGARLCALVEATAVAHGARAVVLWTDTRFADAHRHYERLGYVRAPATRALGDKSDTVEYHYRKRTGGDPDA